MEHKPSERFLKLEYNFLLVDAKVFVPPAPKLECTILKNGRTQKDREEETGGPSTITGQGADFIVSSFEVAKWGEGSKPCPLTREGGGIVLNCANLHPRCPTILLLSITCQQLEPTNGGWWVTTMNPWSKQERHTPYTHFFL